MKAPGQGASTVHASRIWSDLFSLLCSMRSRLSMSFFSAKTKPSSSKASPGKVWPCPLPFPEMHRKKARREQRDAARKLALNFIVLTLNVFGGGALHFSKVVPGLGTRLNYEQWQFVKRITPVVDEWNREAPVTADVMGRSAAKVENVEDLLRALQSSTASVARDLSGYKGGQRQRMQTSWGYAQHAGSEVGKLSTAIEHIAKSLEPHRLKFWKRPSFDPVPYLDEANRETYCRPLQNACCPEEAPRPPPVRVRIKASDRLRFLALLDSTGRLGLARKEEVRFEFSNGAFAVPKDQLRDRMVLDARPPNVLEVAERRWIKSLGSVAQLLHFFISPEQELRVHLEDLREFYHAFIISRERQLRNCFRLEIPEDECEKFSAFEENMRGSGVLVPLLKTMAMGDLNAVAMAQASHLGVLLQSRSISVEDLVCLKQRPPRGSWFAGLMIDDLVLVEALGVGAAATESEGGRRMDSIREAYERVGLPRHEGKSVSSSLTGSFWGIQLDGSKGTARPNLSRAVPLAKMLLEVVEAGYVTVGLLELFAGSLTSIFSVRRRFMSALEIIYAAQRGRSRSAIIEMSPELKDELLMCIPLVAVAHIDFRLEASPWVVASDASMQAEAACRTWVGQTATKEMQRHTLQKGMWSRLLKPEAAYRRSKHDLPPEEELPEGEYTMHPLWQETCTSLPFENFGPVKRCTKRRHINVGEMSAALAAEKTMGQLKPSSYYIHLQDSQVSLAALQKGRSSSHSLNRLMQESIPHHVSSNIKPFYGYVESKRNPADDPSRFAELRKPDHPPADWFADFLLGSFDEADRVFEELLCSRQQVSELPPEDELMPGPSVDTRSSKEMRRQKRRKRPPNRGGVGSVLPAEGEAERGGSVLERNRSAKAHPTGATSEQAFPIDGRMFEAAPKVGDGLGEELVGELISFLPGQFRYNKRFGSLEEALKSGPGVLELYAGSGGFSKAAVRRGCPWSLSFDILHDSSEDLSQSPLQLQLIGLVSRGAFLAMGAGPVCASFSTAITPPCRSKLHPDGVSWCSDLQKAKNRLGNDQLRFVLRIVEACCERGIPFWVENPDQSWLWKQTARDMDWRPLMEKYHLGDCRLDFCTYGTRWRKRTRFRTNTHISGQTRFCTCSSPHIVLRGRCKEKGMNFTKLAEPYPRGVSDMLAIAVMVDSGRFPWSRRLNIAGCAKSSGLRIGEAENPGPRRRNIRTSGINLAEVSLLEPATIALRGRIWKVFSDWVEDSFCAEFLDSAMKVPLLFVQLLIAFGYHCFDSNMPLHYYRQMLAHVQREMIGLRPFMAPAWEVCSKWELVEPIQHRPPLPEPILKAMATVGLAWKWRRWTACLLFAFYAVARIGEVIRARRENLLTPADLLSEQEVTYLQIEAPKSRRRGARVQYVTVYEPDVIKFVSSVWQDLPKGSVLFPLSPGAFRSRWNAVMKRLAIPSFHRLTPGSLRAGGAVCLHKQGCSVESLLWRMRLQHLKTLSYYLQEVTASSILPSLEPTVRESIQCLQAALPFFLLVSRGP